MSMVLWSECDSNGCVFDGNSVDDFRFLSRKNPYLDTSNVAASSDEAVRGEEC